MKNWFTIRGLVFSACFAALFVLSSFLNIRLGFTPVPITLENMVVMLAGAILGAKYGFLSMCLVIALGATGLPLFGGRGGLAHILGPTGGFIWMFPVAALLIGFLIRKLNATGMTARVLSIVIMFGCGSLLLYVTGVPWLAHRTGLSLQEAMVVGCYPYLLGDAVKAVIAAHVALIVNKVFPPERIVGRSAYSSD